jgi:hypothetical protein
VAAFLFVLHKVGATPQVISILTGGYIKINPGWSFYKVLLEIARGAGIAIPAVMAIWFLIIKLRKTPDDGNSNTRRR